MYIPIPWLGVVLCFTVASLVGFLTSHDVAAPCVGVLVILLVFVGVILVSLASVSCMGLVINSVMASPSATSLLVSYAVTMSSLGLVFAYLISMSCFGLVMDFVRTYPATKTI